jgi:hypothetical protein
MEATPDGAKAGKPKKQRAAKEPVPAGAPKEYCNLYISGAAFDRLGVHALKRRRTKSEIVEELINTHLKTYVIHTHGQGDGENQDAGAAPPQVGMAVIGEKQEIPASTPPAPAVGAGEKGKAPLPAAKASKKAG